MQNKYELTTETKYIQGHKVYKIKYSDEANEKKKKIYKKVIDGGWIESERNLSQDGDAFVLGDACVFAAARVSGNARVYGKARVHGCAWITENARVGNRADVGGHACILNNAFVGGKKPL